MSIFYNAMIHETNFFFIFLIFSDGKEFINDPHGTPLKILNTPTANVYIKDHEKQQHQTFITYR